MRTRFRCEADEWTNAGSKITTSENLQAIRRVLEHEGPIIVEHQFYRGASAPERAVFDDFDEFIAYLNEQASAGDNILVWNYASLCRDDDAFASGKCPDDDGLVPNLGAY